MAFVAHDGFVVAASDLLCGRVPWHRTSLLLVREDQQRHRGDVACGPRVADLPAMDTVSPPSIFSVVVSCGVGPDGRDLFSV